MITPDIASSWSNAPVWILQSSGHWMPGIVTAISSKKNDIYTFTVKSSGEHVTVDAALRHDGCLVEGSRLQRRDLGNTIGVHDLTMLSHINEPEIINCLRERYGRQLIYSMTGPVLFSINPYEVIEGIYDKDVMHNYYEAGKRGNVSQLPPHPYRIAEMSYRGMLVDPFDASARENQTVIITGDSGAGKTECTKLLLKYFAEISSRVCAEQNIDKENGSDVELLIISSNPISESFGNAHTANNKNSSRFGRFIELLYTADGYIESAMMRTYLLETMRVTHQTSTDRNFHVFYEVLAGLPQKHKNEYGLTAAGDYKYLNNPASATANIAADASNFTKMCAAMDALDISAKKQQEAIKVIAGILHLGNLVFEEDRSESIVFSSSCDKHVKYVCKLLGYTPVTLLKACTMVKITVIGKDIVKKQTVSGAGCMRDRLSKTLYDSLFKWMIVEINRSIGASATSADSAASSIGILDIFGFERCERNTFEQLCINFANEKLQDHFNFIVFRNEKEMYNSENLIWDLLSNASDENNENERIALFESKHNGLFSVLNDHMKLPQSTDDKFVHALYRKLGRSSYFSASDADRAENRFVIRHYAGDVTYHADEILEKNRGFRVINFATLVGDPAAANIGSDAIAEFSTDNSLYAQKSVTARGSLQHQNSSASVLSVSSVALGAGHLSKSKSAPGKHKTGKSSISTSVEKRTKSVCSTFAQELNDLLLKIRTTRSHFIRCIKPNESMLPRTFDVPLVTQQFRSGGTLEAVKVLQVGLQKRFDFASFVNRYRATAYPVGMNNLSRYFFNDVSIAQANGDDEIWREVTVQLLSLMPISHMILNAVEKVSDAFPPTLYNLGVKVGVRNVFVTSTALEFLDTLYQRSIKYIALHFQRFWQARSHARVETMATPRTANRAIRESMMLFSDMRLKSCRRDIVAAITIQRTFRRYKWKCWLRRQVAAAVTIQRMWRGKSVRVKSCRMHAVVNGAIAAATSNGIWPMRQAKKLYERMKSGSEFNNRELELEIARLLELNAKLREEHMRDIMERDETIRSLRRELMLQTHTAKHHPEDELEFMYIGTEFVKVGRSGSAKLTRLWLSEDWKYLHWESGSWRFNKQCYVDLSTVKHIRLGQKTRPFSLCPGVYEVPGMAEKSFSLITDERSLDLVAGSDDEFARWTYGLSYLINDIYTKRRDLLVIWAKLVQYAWRGSDVHALNVFEYLIQDDIRGATIPLHVFVSFWASTQGDVLSSEAARELVSPALPNGKQADVQVVTYQAFVHIMSNTLSNGAFRPNKSAVYQDMTQPLSHYYIQCSDASHEAVTDEGRLSRYVNDIRAGVRCLELHCWDGDEREDYQPVVCHNLEKSEGVRKAEVDERGRPIPGLLFRDVIEALRDVAVKPDAFPLILILESHCSLSQQALMAQALESVFGVSIVRPGEFVASGQLPSPSQLRGRVIIIYSSQKQCFSVNLKPDVQVEEPPGSPSYKLRRPPALRTNSMKSLHGAMTLSSESKQGEVRGWYFVEDAMDEGLSELAAVVSRRIKNLSGKLTSQPHWNVLGSCSEVDMLYHLSINEAVPWIRHNATHMSRVYPDDRLVEMEFNDPVRAWAVGCQFVSVNLHDEPVKPSSSFSSIVAQGKFLDNGSCGYVLKPVCFLNSTIGFGEERIVTVHIISAQNLRVPSTSTQDAGTDNHVEQDSELLKGSPYVMLDLNGLPQDCVKQTTLTADFGSEVPIWDEVFEFNVRAIELASLTIRVCAGDALLAWTSYPLTCFRVGLRNLALQTRDRTEYSNLFIRFDIR